jgi:uncharacterized membrane protein
MVIFIVFQEQVRGFLPAPSEIGIEQTIFNLVQWLKLGVEVTGAVVISIGIVATLWSLTRSLIPPQLTRYNEIRLLLSRFLALALEFQLGADILSTAIAPSWDQIGKLGAIAFIRTVLNYFLTREMSIERAGINADPTPPGSVKPDDGSRQIVSEPEPEVKAL